MQLVSVGIQDDYLTGNPQITFFKSVYRRHTNFAIETIEQVINGVKDIESKETFGIVNISKNGDLLTNVYVVCDQILPGIRGNKLINEVELILGGSLIDKHNCEWMEIYNELYIPESKKLGYKYMTGGFSNNIPNLDNVKQQKIMIPLRFFFCKDKSQALPIIALQFNDITIKFKWGTINNINRSSGNNSVSCEVWCDYIFLDQDERKRFSESTHEYLIEQLQYREFIEPKRKYDLNFFHPVKTLFWTEKDLITTQKANLHLNGTDRFYKQSKEYFQLKQPYEHFTSIPGYNIKEQDIPQIIKPIPLTYYDDNSNGHSYAWIVADKNAVNSDEGFPSSSTFSKVIIDSSSGNDYTKLMFEHNHSIQKSLDVKKGDIILTSISVKDPTNSDDSTLNNLGQDSITFISQIDTIEGNDINPSTATILKVKPNKNISISNNDKYVISIEVIARYNNTQSRCSDLNKTINCYSFALNPEDHQPSGTCNFSKIDDIKLVFSNIIECSLSNPLTVYALNYNVLRIKNGVGGLAYSN